MSLAAHVTYCARLVCVCRPDPQQTEDSHEIIVCHGNVIRYWVSRHRIRLSTRDLLLHMRMKEPH